LTLKKRLLAAVLSSFVPGLGEILLGKRRGGTVLLLAFGLVLFGFWPLRLLRTFWGLILLIWSTFAILAIAVFRAFFAVGVRGGRRPSWAWTFLLVLIVWVGLNVDLPLALLGSGFRAFKVSSSSMNETLDLGDRFMVDRWYYRHTSPVPGDLVVIKTTALVVKRVIAVGGDTVESRDGIVSVNHKELDEPYVQHTGGAGPEMQTFGPITVPSGKLFLMGDNRDVSYDSRSLGALDTGVVVAKPLYIYGFNRHRRGKVLR